MSQEPNEPETFQPWESPQEPAEVILKTSGDKDTKTMNGEVVSLLTAQLMGGLNAATSRRVDGADAHAEHSRTGYLIGKDRMSIADAMGYRTATESGSGRVRELGPSNPS